ncbi:radical SAM protein [Microbacterium thalassium]|uniref:Pyruvate-formate lyase-activating enzyme n=1 Tax=Microbacterium thalassium TaxID=362649 RepID=A0A7X0KTI3_9MICO|nr:radical SAM protein [Microbacterium thalassium]MBB6390122.1 pyruvate-formate lyase-activating enzyme [Microbacterium thalassium]GLK25230.1 molybdopterin biosynthesis protein MoeX [Microbacterium thalassium]
MVNHALVLDLIERLAQTPVGETVSLDVARGAADPDEVATNADLIAAWCRASGNELVEVRPGSVVVRHGRGRDPLADLAPEQLPGHRLWMYANFDCNLHCDYCCVSSSPQTARRALGAENVARLAGEAVPAGVEHLILTGGEPFLLNDIDELVSSCTERLPTTLLTNGMLFRGARLERLRRMDRDRLTLQISLDSPTPEQHDSHRGHGAWERAVAGIRLALDEGFDVKVAATLPAELTHQVEPFKDFLAELGIRDENRVIRAVARQGVAEDGIELPVDSLIPEVTITAEGVWWHPVSAIDEAYLVQREIFPLADAIATVRGRFADYRRAANSAADWFPCS